MQFNRKDPNPGVFFKWPEGEGGVWLRPLTIEKRQEIDRLTITVEKVFLEGLVYHDRQPDEDKRFELINDYCIEKWSGLVNESGEDMECTTATKMLVLKQDPRISRYITECMEKLNKVEAQRPEKERKNSSKS